MNRGQIMRLSRQLLLKLIRKYMVQDPRFRQTVVGYNEAQLNLIIEMILDARTQAIEEIKASQPGVRQL
jgi:hypothetical protein